MINPRFHSSVTGGPIGGLSFKSVAEAEPFPMPFMIPLGLEP